VAEARNAQRFQFLKRKKSWFPEIAVYKLESYHWSWHQWLTPVILATWEAEIRRITVQGQLKKIVCETLSPK
jgi:hypothetical protein